MAETVAARGIDVVGITDTFVSRDEINRQTDIARFRRWISAPSAHSPQRFVLL